MRQRDDSSQAIFPRRHRSGYAAERPRDIKSDTEDREHDAGQCIPFDLVGDRSADKIRAQLHDTGIK